MHEIFNQEEPNTDFPFIKMNLIDPIEKNYIRNIYEIIFC